MSRLLAATILTTAFLTASCAETVLGPDPDSTPSSLFEQLWSGFKRRYAPMLDRQLNWDSLGDAYRPLATRAASESELFATLCQLLTTTRDPHVRLTAPTDECHVPRPIDSASATNQSLVRRKYVRVVVAPHPSLVAGTIADSIGYLAVTGFPTSVRATDWHEMLARVGEALESVDRLIVDLRDNYGGSARNALALCGSIVTGTRPVLRRQFRIGDEIASFSAPEVIHVQGSAQRSNSIVVITNNRTSSAGEWATQGLRQFPNVTTVGDTTAGMLGSFATAELSNGWFYTITVHRVTGPDGEILEGRGIAPDVFVANNLSDLRDTDRVLEYAIALVRR